VPSLKTLNKGTGGTKSFPEHSSFKSRPVEVEQHIFLTSNSLKNHLIVKFELRPEGNPTKGIKYLKKE